MSDAMVKLYHPDLDTFCELPPAAADSWAAAGGWVPASEAPEPVEDDEDADVEQLVDDTSSAAATATWSGIDPTPNAGDGTTTPDTDPEV